MCFANSDKLRNLCKFYYQLFITVDDVDAEEASSAGRTFLMELNLLSSFEAHRPFPRGTSSSIQDVFQMMMKSVGGGLWRREEVWSESCSFIQIHVRAKAASIIISKTTLIWRAKRGGKWRNGWTFFLETSDDGFMNKLEENTGGRVRSTLLLPTVWVLLQVLQRMMLYLRKLARYSKFQ